MIQDIVAAACLIWYTFILVVCAIGAHQMYWWNPHRRRYCIQRPPQSISGNSLPWDRVPHVTIIRPVKGIEPYLYECLASTFVQTYPSTKVTRYLCVASREDPARPILERVLADFPDCDAKIFYEDEDPYLSGQNGRATNLGPNPKIRNMSRAYREAKGDIAWIIDCNVWVGPDTTGRMVDLLCGFTSTEHQQQQRKYKFVHQLPLVVDVSGSCPSSDLNPPEPSTSQALTPTKHFLQTGGGLLEELFLSTSHAKFYTAINTVAIAPCIVGKSNMFRRSHLNALTSIPTSPNNPAQPGIDHFSSNICEDHLIGDLLWYSPVPPSVSALAATEGEATQPPHTTPGPPKKTWDNHALLPPHPLNLAIQPMSSTPLTSYLSRRIRWLRVRKFTVTLATLVEPGTESLICSLYAAYGLTTLPYCRQTLGIPQTWTAFFLIWLASVGLWATADRMVWGLLHASDYSDEGALGHAFRDMVGGRGRRPWWVWAGAWVGREALALPVWMLAVLGGTGVAWRGRRFRVGVDMKVREIWGGEDVGMVAGGGKARVD